MSMQGVDSRVKGLEENPLSESFSDRESVDELANFSNGVNARDLLDEPNRTVEDTQTASGNKADSSHEANSTGSNLDAFSVSQYVPSRSFEEYPLLARGFKVLQKWEGYVLEVGEDTFTARLFTLLGEGAERGSELVAEIYINAVPKEDRKLIEEGAVFYWSIGISSRGGTDRKSSIIRFRRLPAWSEREIADAYAEAARLKALFDAG